MIEKNSIRVRPATGRGDMARARALFEEYANWLAHDHGISLDFQGIEAELDGLPGKYAPPAGQIFLGTYSGEIVGCAAFRPYEGKICEIKRLYVCPADRGLGLGGRLVSATLEGARTAGYDRAILDTAGFMTDAQALYARFGFEEIAPYYDNPVPGVRYMGADLIRPAP